jgi:small subunit ribosomal protein S20
MANHKSAIKRHRQSLVRRSRNRSHRAEVRTALKAASAAKGTEAKELAKGAESLMAKAAKKGIFHKKTLARKISRLNKQVAKSVAK